MKIYEIDQRTPEWHDLRQGRITGTTLWQLLWTPKAQRTAYYETLAERLSTESFSEENPMMRWARLEDDAVEEFEKITWKKVDKIWFTTCDDNPFIASSPDGLIKIWEDYSEWIEIKCLGSWKHVMAWLEWNIPEEYDPQILQYFIVNEKLQKLYFIFYDPRITIKKLFWIVVTRESVAEQVAHAKQIQITFLQKIDDKLLELLWAESTESSSTKTQLEQ